MPPSERRSILSLLACVLICIAPAAATARSAPTPIETFAAAGGDAIRLREGQSGPVRYTLDDDKIREGQNGKVLVTIHGEKVREGQNGKVLLTVKNGRVREGQNGKILFTIRENRVQLGQNGKVLYTLKSRAIREGQNGRVLFSWTGGRDRLDDEEVAWLVWHLRSKTP